MYLLKDKTQVSGVIKNFINEIKTHCPTTVRLLRSDNALEYTQGDVFFMLLIVFYIRLLVHTLHNIMVY